MLLHFNTLKHFLHYNQYGSCVKTLASCTVTSTDGLPQCQIAINFKPAALGLVQELTGLVLGVSRTEIHVHSYTHHQSFS